MVSDSFNASLQDKLDRITQNTRALVQPERLAISEQAIAELFNTGVEDRVLNVGAQAPAFTLDDALTSKPVNSVDLLALGPLVISFFRGRWDPYCVTELVAWRNLHADLRKKGAIFVSISPQTTRQNSFTLQQHTLPFPLLSDPGAVIADRFGIAHTIPPMLRRYYQSILVNIPHNNAGLSYETATDACWRLPLPAVFVIDRNNTILFSEAHADFRVRPEPMEVLDHLEAPQTKSASRRTGETTP
jgi:peroxiredoxin